MTTTTPQAPDTGKALRIALAQKNMKRKVLADAVGISENYASRLAVGNSVIQGELLNKIAAAFGMKVSEFVALGED